MVPWAPAMIDGAHGMIAGAPAMIDGPHEMIAGAPAMAEGTPGMIAWRPAVVAGTPALIAGRREIVEGSPGMTGGIPALEAGASTPCVRHRSVCITAPAPVGHLPRNIAATRTNDGTCSESTRLVQGKSPARMTLKKTRRSPMLCRTCAPPCSSPASLTNFTR